MTGWRDEPLPSPAFGPRTHDEALRELTGLAEGRFGHLAGAWIARHVVRVTAGADWPVQRAALEALLRRSAMARRDELRVAVRPPGGAPLGRYGTRAPGASARPYATLLTGVEPLSGGCACPDYRKSSLGICKHLFTVLDAVAAGGAGWARARRDQAEVAGQGPRLLWDPVRPFAGPGDFLERVRFVAGDGGWSAAAHAASRLFGPPGADATAALRAIPEDPEARLALVRVLLGFARPDGRARHRFGGDPALVPLLDGERERLERIASGGLRGREVARALRDLKQRLYPYQREGVERFLASGRLLLADDMGLGKTAQAIAACHALFRAGKVRRGVVVAPASLKSQWLREWRLFSDVPVEVVEGGPGERHAAYRALRRGFLVVNYEQVVRDLSELQRLAPDLVVLDEAQRIKNWATKTASHVKALDVRYRLVLTGTPMENRLDELASILSWVDELALEPRWRLAPWHAQLGDGRQEVRGARNLGTLRERLGPALLRRTRAQVLGQLPARTDVRVPVPLTPEQEEEHASLDQPIAQLVRKAKKRPLTQPEFLRLMSLLTQQRIICNGLALRRFEEEWPALARERPSETLLHGLCAPKLAELRELVSQVVVGQERKLVVFSQWRRMLQLAAWAVSDVLSDAGLQAVFFTGQEGLKRRTQNVIEFHDDPRTRVFFATDAGGVGLNLQRAANALVNLELPWNPAVLEQRIGRIHRMGQRRPIDVFHLVAERGIEARIEGLVGDKQALFKGLFDGGSDEVLFDRSGSFLQRVEELVGPAPAQTHVDPEPDADGEADGEAGLPGDAGTDGSDESALAAASVAGGQASGVSGVSGASTAAVAAAVGGAEATAVAVAAGGARSTGPAGVLGLPVAELLSQLQVRRRDDGGLSIEAPPEAAESLAALFLGMARAISPSPQARA